MKRIRLSTRQRVECFEAADGVCHICEVRINAGERWEVEHVIALEAGGEDVPENRRPSHVRCHALKTRADHKTGAKIKRVRARHLGAKAPPKNPIPGSRGSGWRKPMHGPAYREENW